MEVVLGPLISVILMLMNLYIFVLFVSIVLTWLIAFKVVNTSNRFVFMVVDFAYRLTEPALRPIRRRMPDLGGIDISPVILLAVLWFIEGVLTRTMVSLGAY